jgi:hypothetical protein
MMMERSATGNRFLEPGVERTVLTYIKNRSKGTRDGMYFNDPSGDISPELIHPNLRSVC